MTRAEELCLALRAQQGDLAARNRLVEASLPTVRRVARLYRGRGLPLEDLVEEGVLGVFEAIPRYDPARCLDFMGYAYRWIRNALSRAVNCEARPVRLPAHLAPRMARFHAAREGLRRRLGREPTPEEVDRELLPRPEAVAARLAESLGRPPAFEEVHREILRRAWSLGSVWRLYEFEDRFPDSRPLESLSRGRFDVPDRQAEEATEAVLQADDDRRRLERALASLEPRVESVLRLRYGLAREVEYALPGFPLRRRGPGVVLTLKEIGDLFGLSRERVRQIEAEGLREVERRLVLEAHRVGERVEMWRAVHFAAAPSAQQWKGSARG